MYKDPVKERLHGAWAIRRSKGDLVRQWHNFEVFYDWAIQNGYGPGKQIRKHHINLPAGPENCFITAFNRRYDAESPAYETQDLTAAWSVRWDKTTWNFLRLLEKASPKAISGLVGRIRNKTMPPDWYKKEQA